MSHVDMSQKPSFVVVVSLLREFIEGEDFQEVELPSEFLGDRPLAQPVEVLDSSFVLRDGAAVEHVLVRWSDDATTPSWEPLAYIRKHFPTLHHGAKATPNRGGVDKNTTMASVEKTGDKEANDNSAEREDEIDEGDAQDGGGKERMPKSLRPRDQLKPPKHFLD